LLPADRFLLQNFNYAKQGASLTICADGSWCCGNNNYTCCNNNQGIQLAAVIGSPQSGSTGGGSSTAPAVPGPSGPQQPSNTDMVPKAQVMTVGLAVGIPLAVIAIGTGVCAFLLWKRTQKRGETVVFKGEMQADGSQIQYHHPMPVEVSGLAKPAELTSSGRGYVAEVPGDYYPTGR
jgi:hypothetical protein